MVGEHDGAVGYTVGQRRGLRLGRPAADGRPRYVLDVSVVSNTVTVGPAEALQVNEIVGTAPVWLGSVPSPADQLGVQIRAHGSAVPCQVHERDGDAIEVSLHQPLSGVAAGQTLALYDGTRVVGAATVTASRRAA